MPIAFRHKADPSPVLTELPGFAVHQELSADAMARMQQRTVEEIQRRFDDGHRAYVATIDGVPAAWGWVASSVATVGEVGATLTLGYGERYLWNFVTLAAFRGRGIYPRLLNAMVLAESDEGERFWVAYAPENHASGAGIRKAGFSNVAEVSFDLEGHPAVKSITLGGGGQASRLLNIREIEGAVTQCWRCAKAGKPKEASCAEGSCACDYQHKQLACGPIG